MPCGIRWNNFNILLVVFDCMRARADDGHVALNDIDELGQFVQASASEEASKFGDAGVAFRGLR